MHKKKIEIVGIPIFIEPKSGNQKLKSSILWNHRLQKQKNPWVLFKLERFVKNKISVCTPEALSAAYSKEMKEHERKFTNVRPVLLKLLREFYFLLNLKKIYIYIKSLS